MRQVASCFNEDTAYRTHVLLDTWTSIISKLLEIRSQVQAVRWLILCMLVRDFEYIILAHQIGSLQSMVHALVVDHFRKGTKHSQHR